MVQQLHEWVFPTRAWHEMTGEDAVACPAGHVVCRECLHRGAQELAYGAGRTEGIRCLSVEGDDCAYDYADAVLQLALPKESKPGGIELDPAAGGESISSLVHDPALIAKMIVLSLISLIPVLFKVSSI